MSITRAAALAAMILSTQAHAHGDAPHAAPHDGATGQRMCAQDARQCPAGTAKAGIWVGRSGNSCEFDCGASALRQPPRRPDIQKPQITMPTMEELERRAARAAQ